MKTKNLINLITQNFTVKVICVVVAIFLYGMHRASLLERRTFTVPLSIQADGSMYPMSDWPEYVRVSIRSTTENIAEALQSDISATLDLTTYENEGSYTVPVSLNLAPKLLLMNPFEVTVKPETVSVRMEEKVLKYVNVEASLLGEPAPGYEVSSVSVSPSNVEVIGPVSSVNSTKRLFTDRIDVSGLSHSKEYDVSLNKTNSLLQVQNEKSLFHVRVVIEESPLVKEFSNVSPALLFLSPQLELAEKIESISFEIKGTVPTLESFLLDNEAVYIDCSGINVPGEYELPVLFSLPAYFTLQNKSSESIKIKIKNYEKNEDSVSEEDFQ